MKGKSLIICLILIAAAIAGYRWLPSYYNPFAPLTLDDPPGTLTQFKLRPLSDVVRVRSFGSVSLSSSFLASCPLALSWALFVNQQARPITETMMGSGLSRIDHFGSFACRNIYHRANARRSEHATAEALDISGFPLENGQRISVLRGWKSASTEPWLRALLSASCGYFGNALGPDYNAAHANHFHLGMRGVGYCPQSINHQQKGESM